MTDLLTTLLLASLLGLGIAQTSPAGRSTTPTATSTTINPDPGTGTVPPG